MAISRHKVLSEMQQQLELASSKCGNLQKQLEIVKDKVRKSSTTSLVPPGPPDEKENDMDESPLDYDGSERNSKYQQALSLSSSSAEDVNDERDVNIIKVFYDRLGQMNYSVRHDADLSDISSEGNDLDIDQIISNASYPTEKQEGPENGKRKEKRAEKKSKEKAGRTTEAKKKKSKSKATTKPVNNPYENHFTKMLKAAAIKKKNQKNNLKSVKVVATRSAVSDQFEGNKPVSRCRQPKQELPDKPKKKRQVLVGVSSQTQNIGKRTLHDPLKRGSNLASELRKTKSSTGAVKRECFSDSRSLTRLQSCTPPSTKTKLESHETSEMQSKQHDSSDTVPISKILNEGGTKKVDQVANKSKGKIDKTATEKEDNLKKPNRVTVNSVRTSLSDLIRTPAVPKPIAANIKNSPAPPKVVNLTIARPNKNDGETTTLNGKNETTKLKSLIPERLSNPMEAPIEKNLEPEKRSMRQKMSTHITTVRNNDSKPEVKKKVSIYENTVLKTKTMPEDTKVNLEKSEKVISRRTLVPATRTSTRSTVQDDEVRLEEMKSKPVQVVPHLPVYRNDLIGKVPTDASPLTVHQMRRIKDNIIKFTAIPFIVGQSTTKSYHIGLNIQQTYSLFKQTPSMTALKVSKFVDTDYQSVHSRARSTKSGFSDRSVSSRGGAEFCPACDPVPDPSPEQMADRWAVPQDNEGGVYRVCTCLPRRIISFDEVLNQLYFSDSALVKLQPSFIKSKTGLLGTSGKNGAESKEVGSNDKSLATHKGTNTLYYTKLLRSIQNFKNNMLGQQGNITTWS